MSKALYSLSDSPEFLFDEERLDETQELERKSHVPHGLGHLGGTLTGGAWARTRA